MTHKERILAAVRGEWLDKPCYAAWGPHYSLEESNASDLAKAMIGYEKMHDFDLIKVMSGGMYFPEAFGQKVAPATDINFQSWISVDRYIINDACDWLKITPQKIVGNSLAREVECVKRINDHFHGEVPVLPTIFSPFIMMGEMTGGFFREDIIVEQFRYHEKECLKGLEVVEETLMMLMDAFVDAGAAGFFYGVQNTMARLMGKEMFDAYEKAPSLRCLNAVKDKTYFNMLHMCNGRREECDWFVDYPVQALNWADTHTPVQRSMAEMREISDKVLVGGLAHRLPNANLHSTVMESDFTGMDRQRIKDHIKSRVLTTLHDAGNKVVVSGGCGWQFEATHRFNIWHEVMDEIAEERAKNRQ